MKPELASYRARCERIAAAVRAGHAGQPLGLAKRTSNLFRDRREGSKQRLDLGDFRHVLEVDVAEGWVDTEGLVTYEALVEATLAHGVMPRVVPQLKTITAGGAVAGVGIEATSFRHGLVHDTLLEADVLLASGEIVTCRPDNEHRDLFLGLPNSYGTLGYALRLRLRTQPVRPFVQVEHLRFSTPPEFFAALQQACDGSADFVDGVVFARDDLVLNVARFVDAAPALSDYTYEHIYYRSLRDKPSRLPDAPPTTSGAGTPTGSGVRRTSVRSTRWCAACSAGERLNSRTYTRLMRWNARWGLTRRLARLRGVHTESVIQDVDLPVDRAEPFLDFMLAEIGILPIWVCPIRPADPARPFALYPLMPGRRYVNFGFWDVVESRTAHPPGHFNRLVEHRVIELGGIKSLYSDSFFTRREFARAYRIGRYNALKARYDPELRLLGLYEKCVQGR